MNSFKNDVFSLGLVLLNAAILKDEAYYIGKNLNVGNESQLINELQDVKIRYGTLLADNIMRMLRTDQFARATCLELENELNAK